MPASRRCRLSVALEGDRQWFRKGSGPVEACHSSDGCPGGVKVRVLVVEDCRALADLVAEGLSDQGIAADVAYNGTEAAEKLDVNAYDVVVLDRGLPKISGDTLC